MPAHLPTHLLFMHPLLQAFQGGGDSEAMSAEQLELLREYLRAQEEQEALLQAQVENLKREVGVTRCVGAGGCVQGFAFCLVGSRRRSCRETVGWQTHACRTLTWQTHSRMRSLQQRLQSLKFEAILWPKRLQLPVSPRHLLVNRLQVEQLEVEQQEPAGGDQGGVIPFHAPPLTDSRPPPQPRVNGAASPMVRRGKCRN